VGVFGGWWLQNPQISRGNNHPVKPEVLQSLQLQTCRDGSTQMLSRHSILLMQRAGTQIAHRGLLLWMEACMISCVSCIRDRWCVCYCLWDSKRPSNPLSPCVFSVSLLQASAKTLGQQMVVVPPGPRPLYTATDAG
jgi:hypothetical protein